MILSLILISIFNLYSVELSVEQLKNKAYVQYKAGVNEYNKENYELALQHFQKSLQYRPLTKTRKFVEDIRKKGKSYYETGVALTNFNKELSIQYLKKALPLIDPVDKKTIEHINELLLN